MLEKLTAAKATTLTAEALNPLWTVGALEKRCTPTRITLFVKSVKHGCSGQVVRFPCGMKIAVSQTMGEKPDVEIQKIASASKAVLAICLQA